MRLSLMLLPLALAACGANEATLSPSPVAPADLFQPCEGWAGAAPVTERQLLLAAQAEIAGRRCANERLAALAEIYGAQ